MRDPNHGTAHINMYLPHFEAIQAGPQCNHWESFRMCVLSRPRQAGACAGRGGHPLHCARPGTACKLRRVGLVVALSNSSLKSHGTAILKILNCCLVLLCVSEIVLASVSRGTSGPLSARGTSTTSCWHISALFVRLRICTVDFYVAD